MYSKIKNTNNSIRYKKEFISFTNKIGKHKIWFESLSEKKQWDLLFMWKKYKWDCNSKKRSISIKKFLIEMKNHRRFKVPVTILRENKLKELLKDN